MKISINTTIILLVLFLNVCYADDNSMPIAKLTPGDVYTTSSTIACAAHTGSEPDSIRNVSDSVKKEIFNSYGIPNGNHTGYCDGTKGCEVDHLIPLKIGGANTKANLWPQSYVGKMNAVHKDNLEKRLIARVCRTSKIHPIKLPIKVAQRAIATNWIAAYTKYVINNQ
jgi:hypothetical protein